MGYAITRYSKEYREFAYKNYIADSLQLNPQNKYLTTKYIDLVDNNRVVDTRSADEIALDVISNAGLVMK